MAAAAVPNSEGYERFVRFSESCAISVFTDPPNSGEPEPGDAFGVFVRFAKALEKHNSPIHIKLGKTITGIAP
jgi:hypothetical protein